MRPPPAPTTHPARHKKTDYRTRISHSFPLSPPLKRPGGRKHPPKKNDLIEKKRKKNPSLRQHKRRTDPTVRFIEMTPLGPAETVQKETKGNKVKTPTNDRKRGKGGGVGWCVLQRRITTSAH